MRIYSLFVLVTLALSLTSVNAFGKGNDARPVGKCPKGKKVVSVVHLKGGETFVGPITKIASEIIQSRKGKWVRRLKELSSTIDMLRRTCDPGEIDPVLKEAECALKRHLKKLHD